MENFLEFLLGMTTTSMKVREEDHVEDEDDLEVSCLAEIFGHYFQNKLI